MNDHPDPRPDAEDGDDPVLAAAGARLREASRPLSPTAVEVAALRRRGRRVRAVMGAAAVVALVGGVLVGRISGGDAEVGEREDRATAPPSSEEVEALLASLDAEPVDPTEVQLVSSVSTFADCDGLIGDLRRVGAEHVGSRGFGAFWGGGPYPLGGWAESGRAATFDGGADMSATMNEVGASAPVDGDTLGTNVQVTGVDELDHVKAVGRLVYDLDGRGNLRITDAEALEVLATLDVTPGRSEEEGEDGERDGPDVQTVVSELLVSGTQVVVFGSEVETSEPVEGDPSATRASIAYLTVTMVDAADPAAPTVTDRVRVEGSLVSARLVDDQVRLVTTSTMADLGFVLPTTPASVATALDQNRRIVAASTAADWIPDWERADGGPQALVPCERVHVPDTFSGVAMTSMVTFPIGTGRFAPQATSILAPGSTLYAGLEKVAISSEVWVDPIDRDRLAFDDWQTAVHEFTFGDGGPPSYDGSGIVDGSTVGQFAFGEIGDSLAVVTTEGTPWGQTPDARIDLTVLTPDGAGALDSTARIEDLADGAGEVAAVRFVEGRVLVSTGLFGRVVQVIDVTDPAEPRRAGAVTVPGTVGYFHPLPDGRALMVGSRTDEVGEGQDRRSRSWVQAHLLDVSDADAPAVVSTWERPWSADSVGHDHHAFTWWPDRQLAMWGVHDTEWDREGRPNHAVVLGVGETVDEVAVPEASKPDEVPPPCPAVEVTHPEARDLLGPGGVALRCDRGRWGVEWPRYQCYRVDDATVARFAPGEEGTAAFFACSPAPPPTVGRVLVVAGTPMLLTDQTLERLDPETFASTAVLYHPSAGVGLYY